MGKRERLLARALAQKKQWAKERADLVPDTGGKYASAWDRNPVKGGKSIDWAYLSPVRGMRGGAKR